MDKTDIDKTDIDKTLLKILQLMPSICECEGFQDALYRVNLDLGSFGDFGNGNSSYKIYEKDDNDQRYNFTLKYEDFNIKIFVRDDDKYFCTINNIYHSSTEIKEETYNILLKYCEKYEYGEKNIDILDVRITKDIRMRKINKIIEE